MYSVVPPRHTVLNNAQPFSGMACVMPRAGHKTSPRTPVYM